MVQSAYRDLKDLGNRQKPTDSPDPVSFNRIFNLTFENMEPSTHQGLSVVQPYFIAMHIIRYDATDKRRQWRRKNKGQLKKPWKWQIVYCSLIPRKAWRLYSPSLPVSIVVRVLAALASGDYIS